MSIRSMVKVTALLALFVLLSGCDIFSGKTPVIPLEDFFRNPEKTDFKLSPDGTYLAYKQSWRSRMNIFVQRISDGDVRRITESTQRDIGAFAWANDHRIVYVQDLTGNEKYKLYAVDTDGSNFKDLTPYEGVNIWVIDPLEDFENEMIIALNKRDKRVFDAYRIDINSGKLELIATNPGNILRWITDWSGHIRLAIATDNITQSLLYRENEQKPFREILRSGFTESLEPLFFSFESDEIIYAASNMGRDKRAIVKYDIRAGREVEVIYQHPDVDVNILHKSKARGIITGVTYITDRKHYHFFDSDRKKLHKTLRQKIQNDEIVVASMSKDESRVLVRTYSDKTRGSYYYFDRRSSLLKKIGDVSPWLDARQMADMRPVKYRARDGQTIHGYLTLPKSVEGKNLPVVIHPHGGPWLRDVWQFDPEVQFLANRGYAVLQMNYRGSSGYGRDFLRKGFKQWGRGIQNDITDGAQWLIDQGIADPDRIGIYGSSFGGYTVLAGLAFTPDIYACGIDYVGPANIFTFLESIPPYWEPYRDILYEMIGNPETDKEMLRAVSPIFHVDKIKAAVLIAQGANDPRVKQEESDAMVAELKKHGVDVTYMLKENEGHGFKNEENRFDFYRTMESFLSRHLKKTAAP